jgi:hypothetical protein
MWGGLYLVLVTQQAEIVFRKRRQRRKKFWGGGFITDCHYGQTYNSENVNLPDS